MMQVCQRQRRDLWESLRESLSVLPFTHTFFKSPSSRSLSAIAELLVANCHVTQLWPVRKVIWQFSCRVVKSKCSRMYKELCDVCQCSPLTTSLWQDGSCCKHSTFLSMLYGHVEVFNCTIWLNSVQISHDSFDQCFTTNAVGLSALPSVAGKHVTYPTMKLFWNKNQELNCAKISNFNRFCTQHL